MIILELNQVEIDYCTVCEGIWLDAGELELLLEGAEEKDVLLKSFTIDYKSKEKPIKCPLCSKKMNKILVGTEKSIMIDKCKNNDGLWFDKGELHDIIKLGTLDKENKIVNLLNQMFEYNLLKY